MSNYSLAINVDTFGVEKTADIIKESIKSLDNKKYFKSNQKSRPKSLQGLVDGHGCRSLVHVDPVEPIFLSNVSVDGMHVHIHRTEVGFAAVPGRSHQNRRARVIRPGQAAVARVERVEKAIATAQHHLAVRE